jgi:hypothetical protein
MPQITITIDDQAYWELREVEKGLKSAFINAALRDAFKVCNYCPMFYRKFARARFGREAVEEDTVAINAAKHPDQTTFTELEEKWMRGRKEALE